MSRTPSPLYRELASLFQAYLTCSTHTGVDHPNGIDWAAKHRESIETLCNEFMPSGAGIDCGTKFDFDASKLDKLVLTFSYHHMNDVGMYDGWTEHTLTIRPSLSFDFVTHISGRDRNQIKDYLYDVYQEALRQKVWQDTDCQWMSERYSHEHNATE